MDEKGNNQRGLEMSVNGIVACTVKANMILATSIGNVQIREARIIVYQLRTLFAAMVFCKSIVAHWTLYSGS